MRDDFFGKLPVKFQVQAESRPLGHGQPNVVEAMLKRINNMMPSALVVVDRLQDGESRDSMGETDFEALLRFSFADELIQLFGLGYRDVGMQRNPLTCFIVNMLIRTRLPEKSG